MNKKKSRKRTKITPNKKLINIFLLIFLIAFLTTIASYFTMKNKEAVKDISAEVKIQEINKEPLIPKMAEIKDFKEQSSQEFFEEKFDTKYPYRNTSNFSSKIHFNLDQFEGGAKFAYLMASENIKNYICKNSQTVFQFCSNN